MPATAVSEAWVLPENHCLGDFTFSHCLERGSTLDLFGSGG